MLDKHPSDFLMTVSAKTWIPISEKQVYWGLAVLVLERVHARTMLDQHASDLQLPRP